VYLISKDNQPPLRQWLDGLDLLDDWVHESLRRRNLKDSDLIAKMARQQPEKWRDDLIGAIRAQLPDFDVDTHFTPW
jgi:hypothetical protein